MHTWAVIAFLLAAVATALAGIDKAWPSTFLAAALACALVPAAFQLETIENNGYSEADSDD